MAAGFTSLSVRAHKGISSIVQFFNSVEAFSVMVRCRLSFPESWSGCVQVVCQQPRRVNVVRWSLFPTFGPTASLAFLIGVTLYPVVGDVFDGLHTKDATGFQYVHLVAAGFSLLSIRNHMGIRSIAVKMFIIHFLPDQLFGVGALAHRGLPPFIRGFVRGSFPAPHHHDPNETLPNFQIWVMVGSSSTASHGEGSKAIRSHHDGSIT